MDSVSRIKFLNFCQIQNRLRTVTANTVFSVKLDVQDKFFNYFRIRFHLFFDFCLLQSEVGIERTSTLLKVVGWSKALLYPIRSEDTGKFLRLQHKYSKSLSWAENLNKLFTVLKGKFKSSAQDSELENVADVTIIQYLLI